MKYNININQLVLSKTSFDLIDCAIIDYIYYYCNSKNEKIENQRIKNEKGIWTWINYQTLLRDMPLIKIKSLGALTPRIKKIEQEGYIKTFRQGNQKLFIKLNSKIDELFIETNRTVHENEQSCSPKRTNNNTIDNNTNINIAKKKSSPPKRNPLEKIDLKEEIDKLLKNKTRHIHIIGLWLEENPPSVSTYGALCTTIKRNLRAARDLCGYPDEIILNGIAFVKDDGERANYDPTLETVIKKINLV